MHAFLKAGSFWLSILLPYVCYGQHVPLSALPMQYNSSFAGEAHAPRINSAFTYQPASRPNYNTYYGLNASYDQFISGIRSGVGVSAGYSGGSMPSGNNNGYYFSVAVAPKFSFKGKYTLSPSLDFTYSNSHSTFKQPGGVTRRNAHYGLGSRLGLLFNTDKFYVGYSANLFDHLTHHLPNDSTYVEPGSGFRKTLSSTLQAGYTFQQNAESRFSFTPQLAFAITKFASTRPQIQLQAYNFTFRYRQFIWGINGDGFRLNKNADLSVGNAHVGWQTGKLRLMLSSSTPALVRREPNSPPYRYAGNLSLRYVFKQEHK